MPRTPANAGRRRTLSGAGDAAARRTVSGAVDAAARRTPHAVALRTLDGAMTFAELAARMHGLAAGLRARGAGPGHLVGVHFERSAEMIVAVLAVLAAGAGYVPLDPEYPAARLRAIVADSGMKLLLSGPAGDGLIAGTPSARYDPADWPAEAAAGIEPADGIAYLIYTSGSTGLPKGVVIERPALRNYLRWCDAELPFSGGGAPLFASIAFDHVVTVIFPPLARGEALDLLPPVRGGRALADGLLTGHRYSYVKITPSHLRLLDRAQRAELGRCADLVMLGGERADAGLIADLRRDAPELAVMNHYGPTEATVGCCVHRVPPDFAGATVPIGTPIPGLDVTLRRPGGEPCADDEEGELTIAGRGLARAYWRRPDLTAAAFVELPAAGGEMRRWYRSGDLAVRRGSGQLELIGRIDDQVKILGHRIEPREVEAALRAHPAVRDAAVVARERAGLAELVAAVVASDPVPQAEELRRFCRARLPAAMVPARIVTLDRLPTDVNGKLDRSALLRAAEAGNAATPGGTSSGGASLEDRLAVKWRDVLGSADIAADDDFFLLGGDSMATIEISRWAAERFGVPLEPTVLFDHPTIRALADHIRSAQNAQHEP